MCAVVGVRKRGIPRGRPQPHDFNNGWADEGLSHDDHDRMPRSSSCTVDTSSMYSDLLHELQKMRLHFESYARNLQTDIETHVTLLRTEFEAHARQ